MTISSSQPNQPLLKSYVEKIVSAQTSIQDLQREITRFRQDARADGFNMEAVHQLGLIVAKSPHDNGSGLLRDICNYAHQAGIEIGEISINDDATDYTFEHDNKKDHREVSRFIDVKGVFKGRMSVVTEATLGFIVAAGLIWLLH